jgi:hypothetical protein
MGYFQQFLLDRLIFEAWTKTGNAEVGAVVVNVQANSS